MKILLIIALSVISFSAVSKVQTLGIIGDAGVWNNHSKGVRDSLLKSNIKQLILPGDNIYDLNLNYSDVWSHWEEKNLEFTLVALGNHNKSYAEEMAYFHMPGEFFSKVIEGTRFIVLNSNNVNTAEEQSTFLEAELGGAKETFVVVIFHHPPFTIRHSWMEKEKFQLKVRPILRKYQEKITALVVGHDHIASLVEMGPLPVVVSGAAFESFQIPAIHYQLEGLNIQTKWRSTGGFYWTRLDLNHETKEAWINFVRTDVEEVGCSVRVSPRPLLYRDNCRSSSR